MMRDTSSEACVTSRISQLRREASLDRLRASQTEQRTRLMLEVNDRLWQTKQHLMELESQKLEIRRQYAKDKQNLELSMIATEIEKLQRNIEELENRYDLNEKKSKKAERNEMRPCATTS